MKSSEAIDSAWTEDEVVPARKPEMAGRLASGVAHDMNNALSAIMAFADLALLGAGDDDGLCADIREIRIAAGRAADITRRWVAVAGRPSDRARIVAVNAVVERARDVLGCLVGDSTALSVRLAEDAGSVHADPSHIEQAIINLALHVRDATADSRGLLIETAAANLETACPAVFGVIPAGAYSLVRVFDGNRPAGDASVGSLEPFFTAARGRTLGLPAVHGIIRRSGGWLRVSCEGGKGNCVEIYLERFDR